MYSIRARVSLLLYVGMLFFGRPFAVRRALIYTHRWLGIAGAVLFLAWFASGMVMMYHRMPALDPQERYERLPSLDLTTLAVSPLEAAASIAVRPERIRIGMFASRPVYRLSVGSNSYTAFADDGSFLSPLDRDAATGVVKRFVPEHESTVRHDARLSEPDQWTFSNRGQFPLHRVALGDQAGTFLYVAEQSGEVVMQTTAYSRRWAYAGAVLHWLYFTPFRKHSALWINSVIWLSIAGCVLTLSGIIWGVWRLSAQARYRVKGVHFRSPYAGLMRWHHYAGLVFGLTTFTWVLSGCLSLDPWDWHPSTAATNEQRAAFSGGPLALDEITPARIRAAVEIVQTSFAPKELESIQFRAVPYLVAGPFVVNLIAPSDRATNQFQSTELLAAARSAMPDDTVTSSDWLRAYDDYYYSRDASLPLPVLRVKYDDPQETWLYIDVARAEIVRKEERLTRLNRWLYHGLHNLDFRFLYYRRPLWDIVVILLCFGGIFLTLSSAAQGWRCLRRHARRLSGS
jgi:hypothetical protein